MSRRGALAVRAVTASEPSRTVGGRPGRLNLIGEHTDYNDGFVLPLALPYATTATVDARRDGELRLRSAQRPGEETGSRSTGWHRAGSTAGPRTRPGWSGRCGRPGTTCPAASTSRWTATCRRAPGCPRSAALECAVAAAVADLTGLGLSAAELALVAQRAENGFVGMPCGVMDQMASMLCTAAHALFLDCRSLATEQVPLDLAAAGLAVLVVDTRTPHQLTDGEYGRRREVCEAAARRLGVPALRDVPVAELDAALARLDDDEQRRRVRHVVTENDRVLRTVEALRAGRTAEIGPLLSASHASLRDDFEVTVPQLDVAVGGGRGRRRARRPDDRRRLRRVRARAGRRGPGRRAVREAVLRAYADAGFGAPGFFEAIPSAGAAPPLTCAGIG